MIKEESIKQENFITNVYFNNYLKITFYLRLKNKLHKYRVMAIFVVSGILLLNFCFAEKIIIRDKSNSSEITNYYKAGMRQFNKREYAAAAETLKKGINLLEENLCNLSVASRLRLLKFYKLIANCYRLINHFSDSEFFYKKSLDIAKKHYFNSIHVVGIYIGLGRLYFNVSAFDKSKNFFKTALKKIELHYNLKDKDFYHSLYSKIYNGLGRLYYRQSLYQLAGKYYKKSLEQELNSPKLNKLYTAFMYNNLGNVAQKNGDLDKALELYNRSLRIKNEFSENLSSVIRTKCNIAKVHLDKGELNNALTIFRQAEKAMLNSPERDKIMIAWNYYNTGGVLKSMNRIKKAIRIYKKALKLYKEIYGSYHYMVVKGLIKLGDCYLAVKQFEKAQKKYAESLKISRQLFGEVHADIALAYLKTGEVFEQKRENHKALKNYITASRALRYKFMNYSNENIIDARFYLQTLAAKAELLTKIYEEKGETETLFMAFRNYQTAFQLVDKMLISYKNDGSKFILAQKVSPMYGKAINVVLELFDKTKNSEFKDFAFRFAEKNKSNTLLQKLYLSDASSFARIPKELVEKEDSIKLRLTILDTELKLIKRNKRLVYIDRLKEVEKNYYALKESLEELRKMFEKRYPRYYELKYKNKVMSVKEVKSKLNEKTAVIEYLLTEKKLFLFVLTDEKYEVESVEIPKMFLTEINSMLEGITNRNFKEYTKSSYILYKNVFQPIKKYLKGIENIIIIPDEEISSIPFEALLTKDKEGETSHNYHKLSYLIKDYNITYHLNASLLFSDFLMNDAETKYDYLAFVPHFEKNANFITPFDNKENKRGYLPFSLEEVKQIKSKFSSSYGFTKKIKTLFDNNYLKIFIGKLATEENFKNYDFAEYKYLHFATHCFIDKDVPELSGLILAKGKGTDDGILYLNEIYSFKIKADLVTLSACETAKGKWVHGEGMIGFTRGFLYAGAKNILASFWKVNDYSTSKFMRTFYASIIEGLNKSKSLRKTKLDMINSGYDYAMPYYWASFKLIGNSV